MCGGLDKDWKYLSSCEINVAGEDNWSSMISLPATRSAPRGLTMDNRVLMIGEE